MRTHTRLALGAFALIGAKGFLSLLPLAPASAAMQAPSKLRDPSCRPAAVSGAIHEFKAVWKVCDASPLGTRIATREFQVDGKEYALLVNPDTLETSIEDVSCLKCDAKEKSVAGDSRYGKALERIDIAAKGVRNPGLTKAESEVKGTVVTGDLCPTHKILDRSFFDALMADHLKSLSPDPVPLVLSVSGWWIKHHRADFDWLRELEAKRALAITWVNHSFSHPFRMGLKDEANFLLLPGVNLEQEVLKTEKLLLESGATPSIYFRFPGLMGNSDQVQKLKSLGLIPLGSKAWLAKGEKPVDGSIILVHPNGNEPKGIHIFKDLLLRKQLPSFIPLSRAVK